MGRGCLRVKRDFESVFRHIPVSPFDSPLLGFQWQSRYYTEFFLPFGLRTVPFLFNLFAEVFHWILEEEFKLQGLRASIIHYLDDFLMILPPNSQLERYTTIFTRLCYEVGLSIKESKNEEGTVVSFAGIELDTRRMVIRLPTMKLLKERSMIQCTTERTSVSLLELQRITGYLNFISTVVPLGRTFLQRLYNMQLLFPVGSRNYRRRISNEAKKDLARWAEVLSNAPERSIASQTRERISTWSDAARTRGLGGYYTSQSQPHRQPSSILSIALRSSVACRKEHINRQEMRAVEQVLLYWGSEWKGKTVVMHTDNRAGSYGLANRTIRGASMKVLRRSLRLAADYDLELKSQWISTKDNALADALSRFDHNRVADLAPQLSYPACILPNHGLRIYSNQGYQQQQHTTFGPDLPQPPDATTTHRDPASPCFVTFPTTATSTADVSQPRSLG